MTKTMGSVKAIISNVVNALLDDPSRKFAWTEIKFFTMWWKQQKEVKKNQVRYLVNVSK